MSERSRAENIYNQIYTILGEFVRNSSNYSDILVRQMEGLANLIDMKKPRQYPKKEAADD